MSVGNHRVERESWANKSDTNWGALGHASRMSCKYVVCVCVCVCMLTCICVNCCAFK